MMAETDVEKKMENFECPFTWEMDELKYMETEYDLHELEEVFPLMKLMRCIVHVYEYLKNNKDSQTVLKKLSDCNNVMVEIQKSSDPEISIEAVLFVLRATKCFVFLRLKMKPELKQMLAETKSIDLSEKKQTSTIKACKSIAWSHYWRQTEAIKFIREAITDNPNYDLWYFILGKMWRSKRRAAKFYEKPDAEEIESFEKAYDMMKNPAFGVYLGKSYGEQNRPDKSREIFKKVLPDLPQNDTLLLIIALGFIQIKDFHNANYCLDKVANTSNKMYLHYKGLYHSKQGQYEESRLYLERAIQENNYQAEYNYMYSMQKIKRTQFDLSQHLLQMLDKYRNWPEEVLQIITLHLAYTYFRKDKKIEESLKYFLDAIEINPDSVRLKEHYRPIYLFYAWPEKNIYAILSQDVLPIVRRQPHRFNEKTMQRALELEKYCDGHSTY